MVWPKDEAGMTVDAGNQQATLLKTKVSRHKHICRNTFIHLPICVGVEIGVPGHWIGTGDPSARLEGG